MKIKKGKIFQAIKADRKSKRKISVRFLRPPAKATATAMRS